MKSNAARGLTGIEIVVVTALTMIAVALISPALSAQNQPAKPVVQQAGPVSSRSTRYQIDKVDEGLLLAADANPEASNNALLEIRKQALILAGKMKPGVAHYVSDTMMQAAISGLNTAVAYVGKPKGRTSPSPVPIKLASVAPL